MGVDARMYAKLKEPHLSADEVLTLAGRLWNAFPSNGLWIVKEKDFGKPRHCLTIEAKPWFDGPKITLEPGEQFIEVHFFTRFYGEGYERGGLPLILNVADWLKRNIPQCTAIIYGGDSSGAAGRVLDNGYREELWNHFCRVGHEPYERFFDHDNDGDDCDLCKVKMIRCGWGQTYAAWFCPGCGDEWTQRGDGPRIKKDKETAPAVA